MWLTFKAKTTTWNKMRYSYFFLSSKTNPTWVVIYFLIVYAISTLRWLFRCFREAQQGDITISLAGQASQAQLTKSSYSSLPRSSPALDKCCFIEALLCNRSLDYVTMFTGYKKRRGNWKGHNQRFPNNAFKSAAPKTKWTVSEASFIQ